MAPEQEREIEKVVSDCDWAQLQDNPKQGDPLSSLLFSSVLQYAMEKDKEVWRQEGFGVKLGDDKKYCISNLQFADDVMLIANSLKQLRKMMTELRKMMTDFKRTTERQGLKIHLEK